MLSVRDCTRTCIRARKFGRCGDAGAADFAEQFHLAERQPMVRPVPTHLPGDRHIDSRSSVAAVGRLYRSITKLYLSNFASHVLTPHVERKLAKWILVDNGDQTAGSGRCGSGDGRVTYRSPFSACRRRLCSPRSSSASRSHSGRWRRSRVPRWPAWPRRACSASTSARWSTGRVRRARPDWPIVVAVASGHWRCERRLRGTAGDASRRQPARRGVGARGRRRSGLVAIARELGGDDRVVRWCSTCGSRW